MNATEDGTHSRALLDPGDAAIQISDAEQDMVEISRHIFLRKETDGRNHCRTSYGEKHSSRQSRTGVDHTMSIGFRHGTRNIVNNAPPGTFGASVTPIRSPREILSSGRGNLLRVVIAELPAAIQVFHRVPFRHAKYGRIGITSVDVDHLVAAVDCGAAQRFEELKLQIG